MDWKEKPSRLSLSSSSGTEGYHDANEHHQFPEMSTARAVGLVAVCTTAITISIASNQGMAIALPSIGAALGIPNSRLQWLVSSNSLTTGCFLLLFGRLSDLYGHRRVFLLGMSWTTVWNLGCGFAPNEIGMDIMRGLAGLGTAASIPAA
ncbi:MFS general substrate transporter, partial [Atractiella rhizophila]